MNNVTPVAEVTEESPFDVYWKERGVINTQYAFINERVTTLVLKIRGYLLLEDVRVLLRKLEAHTLPVLPTSRQKESGEMEQNAKIKNLADSAMLKLLDILALADMLSSSDLEGVQKNANRIKTVLLSFNKKVKKIQKSIPVRLFTPGTIFDNNLENALHPRSGGLGDPVPRTLTVKSVHSNGPDNYVIITEEQGRNAAYDGDVKPFSFHISYATGIVKHVPGKLKFESYDVNPVKNAPITTMSPQALQYIYEAGVRKSKNHYITDDPSHLTYMVLVDAGLVDDIDIKIDTGALAWYLEKIGVIREYRHEFYREMRVINKKRFKKAVRQNYNRFFISKKKQIKEQEDYESDMMDDYNNRMDD